MFSTFDPYHQWLGIRDPARPPNHYRLLGVELFEADPGVILTAADRQMTHLRTYHHGKHAELSQRLLNEVAAAKVCLLNPEKRAEYDAQLRQTLAPDVPPPVSRDAPLPSAELPSSVVAFEPTLRRPGRSRRQTQRRRWILGICLLPIVLGGGGYGLLLLQQRWQERESRQALPTEPPAPLAERSSRTADHRQTAESATAEPSPAAPVEPGTAGPQIGDDPRDEAPTNQTSPDDPSPAWTRPGPDGPRPQFSSASSLGRFLIATSQRDFTASDLLLESLATDPTAAPVPRTLLKQAELIHFLVRQFWQGVDEAQRNLQPGQILTLNDTPVTVSAVSPKELVLEAANGERRSFDLRTSEIPADLAIALVEWSCTDSPSAAWRMIGVFLAIDKDGDLSRARDYFQQAEQHGFSSRLLQDFFELIQEEPQTEIAAGPPSATRDQETRDSTKPWAVPTSSEQERVRRVVLAELRDKLDQSMTAAEWAHTLLKNAVSAEEDPVTYYVILREALKKAIQCGDVPTAMSAYEMLQTSYDIDGDGLLPIVLSGLDRRLQAEDAQENLDAESAFALACGWYRLARSSKGNETQRHAALEQTQSWYERALAVASETEAVEIRKEWARISKDAAEAE